MPPEDTTATTHPGFLRAGPWVLALITAALFALSFVTSFRALYEYSLQLGFDVAFAVAFPVVLDAVTIVLAVLLLLERPLRRPGFTIGGHRVPLPTWPLLALWAYFAGSVAGNIGHAPDTIAAKLVAAVPPVSSVLTFHLLLRLLDRGAALRTVAERHEERQIEEAERAAQRTARRRAVRSRGTEQAAVDGAPHRAITETPDRADTAPPAAPTVTVERAEPSAPRHGTQKARAWAWYSERRANGEEPTAPDLRRAIGCHPGQSRKLRDYCEEKWAAEQRPELRVINAANGNQ